MRILFFANHFLPRLGGVEWSVARSAEALAARGHEVTVITETQSMENDTEKAFSVIRFSVPIRRPITRLYYWARMWSMRRLFRSADVLHFHDYTTFVHWFFPLRALVRRPSYVMTFHGFEQWPIRFKHRMFRRLAAACMDYRFGVGSYLCKYYGHAFDAFYIGAPVRRLQSVQRGHEAVFAYVGRLTDDTDIACIARALRDAARIAQEHVVLRIAGEGNLLDSLLEFGDDALHVEYHGTVHDPTPVYHAARYIVATGFLSLMDAFQTGIPVLFPTLNALKRDYAQSIQGIERMAVLLDDSDGLVEQLADLLTRADDVEHISRALRAREFVSHCTWNNIAELFETSYTNIARRE